MNVVESSGWLEYFTGGKNAGFFARPIEDTARLIVPTLSLYEVFKRVLQLRGEHEALQAAALMHQGNLVELNGALACDTSPPDEVPDPPQKLIWKLE